MWSINLPVAEMILFSYIFLFTLPFEIHFLAQFEVLYFDHFLTKTTYKRMCGILENEAENSFWKNWVR